MCKDVAVEAESFNPETKCCTYLPKLASFLVGRVLGDDTEDPAAQAGRATVEERLVRGHACTPLGLGVPSSYLLLYANAQGAFGHSVAMRCPHFVVDGGLCGVWRHRSAICATWFCKHDRGAVGFSFWEAVRELLSAIEHDLSRWCLLELGLGAKAIERALPVEQRPGEMALGPSTAELDGKSERLGAERYWGPWAGREADYFRACAALVDPLDAAAVLRICGPEVALRVEVMRAAWERLRSEETPPRLRPTQLLVIRSTKKKLRVLSYSNYDPIEMPRRLFDALPAFDGRPTDEVLASIVDEGGPRISAPLVRKLADFGVLAPPADPKGEGASATTPGNRE